MYRSCVHNAERNQASQLAREPDQTRHPPGFGLSTTARPPIEAVLGR